MVAVNDRYDGAASPLEMGRQTRCDTRTLDMES